MSFHTEGQLPFELHKLLYCTNNSDGIDPNATYSNTVNPSTLDSLEISMTFTEDDSFDFQQLETREPHSEVAPVHSDSPFESVSDISTEPLFGASDFDSFGVLPYSSQLVGTSSQSDTQLVSQQQNEIQTHGQTEAQLHLPEMPQHDDVQAEGQKEDSTLPQLGVIIISDSPSNHSSSGQSTPKSSQISHSGSSSNESNSQDTVISGRVRKSSRSGAKVPAGSCDWCRKNKKSCSTRGAVRCGECTKAGKTCTRSSDLRTKKAVLASLNETIEAYNQAYIAAATISHSLAANQSAEGSERTIINLIVQRLHEDSNSNGAHLIEQMPHISAMVQPGMHLNKTVPALFEVDPASLTKPALTKLRASLEETTRTRMVDFRRLILAQAENPLNWPLDFQYVRSAIQAYAGQGMFENALDAAAEHDWVKYRFGC